MSGEPLKVMFLGQEMQVIHVYSLEQEITDGGKLPVFLEEGDYPADGKTVVATAHLLDTIGVPSTLQVWDDFQTWRREVMPTLPEEEQLYAPTVDGHELFVIEDAVAYTLMLRSDY